MAVVRLRRRKWAERDEKRPEVGLSGGPGGSDNSAGMSAFCGVPTADQERKENVPNGETGGGRGIRTRGTTASGTCCAWILQQLQTHLPPWLTAAHSLKNNHFTLPSNRLSKNSIEMAFRCSETTWRSWLQGSTVALRSRSASLFSLSRMPEADVRQRLPGGRNLSRQRRTETARALAAN